MTRLIAAGILALALLAAFWLGVRWDDARELRDEISTRERIDNALDRPTGCAWPDRLRGTCD